MEAWRNGEIGEEETKGAEGGFGGGERAKEEGPGDGARWAASPNYLESPDVFYSGFVRKLAFHTASPSSPSYHFLI